MRVLVIDDNDAFCASLRQTADDACVDAVFHWVNAKDRRSLVRICKEWSPNIALLDIFSAGTNSVGLLDEYLAHRLPVIALTDSSIETLRKMVCEHGAIGCECKTENPDELVSLLNKIQEYSGNEFLEQ